MNLRVAVAAAMLMGAPSLDARADTLVEATAAALDTSPALASARARLEAVREEMPIAWAEALPRVTLDASAFENDRSETTFGTQVRDQSEYWIGSIRSSTLLFAGGRAWFVRRQARAQIAVAVARYQDSAQTLVVDVAKAYGDVMQEQAIRAAQEEAVANFTEQRRYVAAHVRNGFLTQTDIAQADARLAGARADLATANARLVTAHEAYLRLVGRPPSDLTEPPSLSGLPVSVDEALLIASENNPGVIGQLANYEANDAAVDIAAASGRARVTVETTDSTFAPSTGPLQDEEESESSVALRLSVPLFAGGDIRARTRQQRHLRDAARSDLEETRRRVHERVTSAWANLNAARTRLESTRARVEAAELAARGVRREQEFGQRSTIDVLDQENELLQARISLAQAQRQAMVAERELAAELGLVVTATQATGEVEPPAPNPRNRRRT
jgi:outer membrane protein